MPRVVEVDGKPVILAKNLPALRRLVRLRGELETLAESPHPIPVAALDRPIESLITTLDELFVPAARRPRLFSAIATKIVAGATAIAATFAAVPHIPV